MSTIGAAPAGVGVAVMLCAAAEGGICGSVAVNT
eukprot:COSAG04_NODE_2343_length_4295_cov_4.359628_1_plen_33_part_10